jgi:hypothetical protein
VSLNPHQAIYAIFAIAHASSTFGLGEIFIPALLAIGYLVLALARE